MELALPGLAFFEPHTAIKGEKRSETRPDDDARKEKRLFCAARQCFDLFVGVCRHIARSSYRSLHPPVDSPSIFRKPFNT
jgi:hypothetical protein